MKTICLSIFLWVVIGILSTAAIAVDYRQEIITYSVDPCYKDIAVRQGLGELMSVSEAVELMKIMQSDSVNKMVDALMPIVRKMDSFSSRKGLYDMGAQTCINAARNSQ